MTPKRKSKRTNKKKSLKKNFNDKGKYSSSTSLKDKQKKILNKLENVVNKIRSIKKKVKKYSNKKNKKKIKSVKKFTNFIKKSNVKFDVSMLVPNYSRKYIKKQDNFSTQPFIEQQYQELQTNFNSGEIAASPFNDYDYDVSNNEQQRFVDDFVTPIGGNVIKDHPDDRDDREKKKRKLFVSPSPDENTKQQQSTQIKRRRIVKSRNTRSKQSRYVLTTPSSLNFDFNPTNPPPPQTPPPSTSPPPQTPPPQTPPTPPPTSPSTSP